MQFGIVGILVAASAAAAVGIAILFGFDAAKLGVYLSRAFWVFLVVLLVIEYRRRAKRFPKK